jgi:hypothetical protein
MDVQQKYLAQARLLQILPRLVALDFKAVTTTNFPYIQQQFGMHEGEDGNRFLSRAVQGHEHGVGYPRQGIPANKPTSHSSHLISPYPARAVVCRYK